MGLVWLNIGGFPLVRWGVIPFSRKTLRVFQKATYDVRARFSPNFQVPSGISLPPASCQGDPWPADRKYEEEWRAAQGAAWLAKWSEKWRCEDALYVRVFEAQTQWLGLFFPLVESEGSSRLNHREEQFA